jgi:hypothetical protein
VAPVPADARRARRARRASRRTPGVLVVEAELALIAQLEDRGGGELLGEEAMRALAQERLRGRPP